MKKMHVLRFTSVVDLNEDDVAVIQNFTDDLVRRKIQVLKDKEKSNAIH